MPESPGKTRTHNGFTDRRGATRLSRVMADGHGSTQNFRPCRPLHRGYRVTMGGAPLNSLPVPRRRHYTSRTPRTYLMYDEASASASGNLRIREKNQFAFGVTQRELRACR